MIQKSTLWQSCVGSMKRHLLLPALLFLSSCAGWGRSCASCNATEFGADWVIVQYRADGSPINCWPLRGVAVANEQATDGIYWQNPSGHLIHVSGWYSRVQVMGGRFSEAATAVGVDAAQCNGGRYGAVAKPIDGPTQQSVEPWHGPELDK